jgi:hypothetical protein
MRIKMSQMMRKLYFYTYINKQPTNANQKEDVNERPRSKTL